MKKEKIDFYYAKWISYDGKVVYSVLIDDYRHAPDNFDYYGDYRSLIKDYPKTKYNYKKMEG